MSDFNFFEGKKLRKIYKKIPQDDLRYIDESIIRLY